MGSTYCYIASTLSVKLNISTKCTTSVVYVGSPLGQSIQVNKMYKHVSLEIQEAVFSVDLIELTFGEFDLILGID